MKKILVINGPNLNLLGNREPEIYGSKTLTDIEKECKAKFDNLELIFNQSNSESEIIEYIHSSKNFSWFNHKCWSFYSYLYCHS